MPALAAGDFVEIRRGNTAYVGVLVHVPRHVSFEQDHKTLLYNGHFIMHRASDVTFQVPGWAHSRVVSKPISSDFATAGLSPECAQQLADENIPPFVLAHIERFRSAVDTYAFDKRTQFGALFRRLQTARKTNVTLDEVAKLVFRGGGDPTPAELFASYQFMIKNSNCFEALSATRMRVERTFKLRQLHDVEDLAWMWSQVRATIARGKPVEERAPPLLRAFLDKAKILIVAHRSGNMSTSDADGVVFTSRELLFIRALKEVAYQRSVFPNPYRQIAVNGIMKNLYPLYGDRPGQSQALQMLKEIGVLTPWENITMYRASDRGQVQTLEGHGLSTWANDVVQEAEIMGRQLLREGAFTFDEEGKLHDEEAKTAEESSPSHTSTKPEIANLVQKLVVSPTGPAETDFYQRDPCAEIRRDFGQLPVYVIDDATAHELDDGMSVEQTPEGLWVHVHIADPTAYIPPSHPLSLSAQLRANSIYLPERHYPMMPDFLSNERFNLGKSQCALTFSARVGEDGELLDFAVKPSIVRNVKIIYYDDVDDILDWSKIYGVALKPEDRPSWIQRVLTEKKVVPGVKSETAPGLDKTGVDALRLLQKTMQRVTQARLRNGGFVPDQLATRMSVSPYPQPFTPVNPKAPYFAPAATWPAVSLQPDNSGHLSPSHTMVAECMVMAGRVAASWCTDNDVPAVYRGQPGILDHTRAGNRDHAKAAAALDVVRSSQDPTSGVVPFEHFRKLLPFMPPAVVSTSPVGHFSMGITVDPTSAGYVKVTSPLRRYKDMIVHWNMKAKMLGKPYPFPELDQVAKTLREAERRTKTLDDRTTRHWTCEWMRRREVSARRGEVTNVSDPIPYVDFRESIDDERSGTSKHGGVVYDALVVRVREAAGRAWVILTELGGVQAELKAPYLGAQLPADGSMIKVTVSRVDVPSGVIGVTAVE
ncbi:hypothetical protein HKX48_004901 [Thoreauomyces humboldtii]|nr:hypothetical protein HKX48_004901 [Thoreauomyces humboldtii]